MLYFGEKIMEVAMTRISLIPICSLIVLLLIQVQTEHTSSKKNNDFNRGRTMDDKLIVSQIQTQRAHYKYETTGLIIFPYPNCKIWDNESKGFLTCRDEKGFESKTCKCEQGNLVRLKPGTRYEIWLASNEGVLIEAMAVFTTKPIGKISMDYGVYEVKFTITYPGSESSDIPTHCRTCILTKEFVDMNACDDAHYYTFFGSCESHDFIELEENTKYILRVVDAANDIMHESHITTSGYAIDNEVYFDGFVIVYKVSYPGDASPSKCLFEYNGTPLTECKEKVECTCFNGEFINGIPELDKYFVIKDPFGITVLKVVPNLSPSSTSPYQPLAPSGGSSSIIFANRGSTLKIRIRVFPFK